MSFYIEKTLQSIGTSSSAHQICMSYSCNTGRNTKNAYNTTKITI